jgi:hypothetical protein
VPRHPLTCLRCDAWLSPADFSDGRLRACPRCGLATELRLFPALFRAPEPVAAAAAPLTDESSCFHHASRRAVVPCDGCGRFLCELCDVEFNGRHLCPGCLVAAQRGDQDNALTTKRVRYDRMALSAALFSILLWPLSLVAGPAALYLAIRHRRTPLSALPVRRTRLFIAGTLGALITLGWLGLLLFWLSRIL